MNTDRIRAEWALIGKEPRSFDDYDVLAASSGVHGSKRLVRTYAPGVPSASLPPDAPAAPPWVTFGSDLADSENPRLSVSIQDVWNGHDHTGRPIWPRRLFWCGYDDLAAAGASYRTMWESVAPVELPRAGGEPVEVVIRAQASDGVLATIEHLGFGQVAAISAALLDAPVAVTGTSGLRLTDPSEVDRLGLLDAVAALLPYGFRVGLTASTAVDNTVAHRIRLVLADYASSGQQAVSLRGAMVTPRSPAARDYLAMLTDKHSRDGLGPVVRHLLGATDACTFDRPDQALKILDGLNRRSYRIRTVRREAESIELSRAFFCDEASEVARTWRGPELDDPTRIKLLRPLLDLDEPVLTDLLGQHWAVIADDFGPLVSLRLDDGDQPAALRAFALASDHADPQAADRLLRMLISPPPITSASSGQDAISRRVELLRRLPVPTPAAFSLTRAALRRGEATSWQGQLARELLAREVSEAGAADRAVGWAAWLSAPCDDASECGWAAALGEVITSDSGTSYDSLRAMITQDARWAVTVVDLAVRAGRGAEVLGTSGLADELGYLTTDAAGRPQAERRVLAAALLRSAVVPTSKVPSAHSPEQLTVTVSRPAVAIYRARKSGMPATQILEVIRAAATADASLLAQLSPCELDEVFGTVEFLLRLSVLPGAELSKGLADECSEFRELVCAGALGAGYRLRFWRSLSRKLKTEEAARRQLRRRLRRLFPLIMTAGKE